MATFSSVTRNHVLQALAEYDARGGDDFLAAYGFAPSPGYTLTHEGRGYDSRAVLGVAHRFATGRLATSDEFSGGMQDALAILRKRGFEVSEPAPAFRPVQPRATRVPRASSPRSSAARAGTSRSSAAREIPPRICPTCSLTLPATGICDQCA
ncbi:MAG TPA: hypothetical protein VGK35_13905 [Actinotalea sp.]|jgi:hypothetical protein